jgi:Uma2 family endonuclease
MINPFSIAEMPQTKPGTPVWEMALQYPLQGRWKLDDYLGYYIEQKLVELDRGCLRFLTPYSVTQARLQKSLAHILDNLCNQYQLGELCYASLPLILSEQLALMPDLYVIQREDLDEKQEYPRFARLVIEIVSDQHEDQLLDYVVKKKDYEYHKIPEYWIVDRFEKTVTVFNLVGMSYLSSGTFRDHESIQSKFFKTLNLTPVQIFNSDEDE